MSAERDFHKILQSIATHPAARGLCDDAAVLSLASLGNVRQNLVFTHDMMVQGVHFLPDADPADVAWKLVAVNLSDLAAMGAWPVGVLLGYPLSADAGWDIAFLAGLKTALAHFGVPLLGGDTVSASGARCIGLTAIGQARAAPPRSGARAGDSLFITGPVGLAGLGLRLLKGESAADLGIDATVAERAIAQHLRPRPRLSEGQRLAPLVYAMMDVSDGLLIDAQRMAAASGLALEIDADAVPHVGDVMAAMVAGDDYELVFAAPISSLFPVHSTPIGHFSKGAGLSLLRAGAPCPLPDILGWEHDSDGLHR
jgi:thiamine-monophosphate kinase